MKTIETMKTIEKARKSFDYQCRKASRCRHAKYYVSCYICPDEKNCRIQAAIERARAKMYYIAPTNNN